MKALLALARILAVRLVFAFASRLPLRSRVVLASTYKPAIDGNLAAIRDELLRRRPAPSVVVLAYRAPSRARGLAPVAAAIKELVGAWYLATSRIFVVDDYYFPIYAVKPRKETTIIQTWHAAGAFKKFGLSLRDKAFGADEALSSRVRIHSNYAVCLASSRATADAYAEAFGQPLERFVWDIGIPRTDGLFNVDEARLGALRRRLGLPEAGSGRRVILYAPTFRGTSGEAARSPDLLDLDLLERELGADHVLLLRVHPFARQRATRRHTADGFVIDVSDEPDVNELMLISDVLVTDYSSVIFEFALLNRPIVFFAPDHDAYERERGFYFDYRSDGPGPVFETTRQVADYLRAGDFDLSRLERFRQHWMSVADGRSTARFVELVVVPRLASRSAKNGGPTGNHDRTE